MLHWANQCGGILVTACKVSLAILIMTGASHAQMDGCNDHTASITDLPGATKIYPLRAPNIKVTQALELFAKNLQIGLILSEEVSGTVPMNVPSSLTRYQYLQELATELNFVWYFDGQILSVSPIDDLQTQVIPLRDHTGDEAIQILKCLGIFQPRFTHRSDDRSRTFLVSGPSAYVELVKGATEAVETATRTDITLLRGNEGSTPAALQALDAVTDRTGRAPNANQAKN